MSLDSIKSILMSRDGCSSSDADAILADARQMIAEGADPEEVLHDELGLEPDYIFDADLGVFN